MNRTIHKQIMVDNQDQHATANGAGSVVGNIVITTLQEFPIGSNLAAYNVNVVGNSAVCGKEGLAKNGRGEIESDTSTLSVNTSDSEDIPTPPNTNEQACQKGRRLRTSRSSPLTKLFSHIIYLSDKF